MNFTAAFRGIARAGLGVPAILIIILAMLVIPLPPFALDVFFTFNIALSLVVLLATVYSERPLDLSPYFPPCCWSLPCCGWPLMWLQPEWC